MVHDLPTDHAVKFGSDAVCDRWSSCCRPRARCGAQLADPGLPAPCAPPSRSSGAGASQTEPGSVVSAGKTSPNGREQRGGSRLASLELGWAPPAQEPRLALTGPHSPRAPEGPRVTWCGKEGLKGQSDSREGGSDPCSRRERTELPGRQPFCKMSRPRAAAKTAAHSSAHRAVGPWGSTPLLVVVAPPTTHKVHCSRTVGVTAMRPRKMPRHAASSVRWPRRCGKGTHRGRWEVGGGFPSQDTEGSRGSGSGRGTACMTSPPPAS